VVNTGPSDREGGEGVTSGAGSCGLLSHARACSVSPAANNVNASRVTPRTPVMMARRGALLPVPIRIHDLSAGGALIECFHEESVGRRVTIEVELPVEGWVTLKAEIVSVRPNYGYAVRWVDVPANVQWKVELTIERIWDERRDR
jgi:hypothetical protein